MDIDMDDIDAPNPGPSRRARFAPKNSKFKPKPKTEQSISDSIPPVKPELDSHSIAIVKAEIEDVAVKIDTDMKLETADPIEKDLISDDLMDVDNVDDVEDEDDVVREIDVYFTPSIDVNTQLYVMQYPLKPCWRPYELDDRCEEVRVKSDMKEVEIDLAVDVDSKNYDSSSGKRMSKQVLASSGNLPCRSGYAVGVLVGNKLYLNPVNGALQLRPSLKRLSEEDDKKAVRKVKSENVEDLGEKDDWIRLKYSGARSDGSSRYLNRMMMEERNEISFLMSSGDYVDSFCPRMPNKQLGPSRSELLKLPLEDRFKTWICQAGAVHRYNALKYLATSESEEEEVLVLIKKLCCLVQGLWVAKSSLLKLEGVEALVRDYALYLFSKNPKISFSDIPKKMKLKNAMEDVLKVFAVRRPDLKDWKFKEPKDVSFVQKHLDIVNEQDQAWEVRGEKLYIQIYGKDPPKMDTNTTKIAPKANANRSVQEASVQPMPAKTIISDKTREVLLKAIEKVLHTHKVCNFQRLGQLLRDASLEAPLPPERELREILKEVAIDIHGVLVLKTSADHSYDGLRRTVIDLLIVEGPNAKLRKAAIIEAGKIRLKRPEIPTIEYNKVMQELCVSRGSVWMLKSGDAD
ncbi:putative DNA-directed RNA polymerase [Heracleum sosnowskyi]|uniref:DNA-directed RNA polymerase n=1 Tax=Heracleum sosnowskyi TaxID=360622 RepID=A0AAD8MZC2_9APIA|nr:putative DNA-directed RNA polymerase [Heracleum sosnowskyi]